MLREATVQGVDRLSVVGLNAGYGNKQVVHDVSMDIAPGSVCVLLGHNGAGKSTTMGAIFGLLTPSAGAVLLDGKDSTRLSPRARVSAGMAYVPSEDFVFPDLSVSENLALGGITERSAERLRERLADVYATWPVLADRRRQLAGTMSGGQRRMLSLGIAMMSGPNLLLLDEPSLGLAPNIVDDLFTQLRKLATESRVSVLLVEQSVAKALRIADDAFVMQSGRIVAHESPDDLSRRDNLWELF